MSLAEARSAFFFPSPLVGEGGALWSAIALLSAPDEGYLSSRGSFRSIDRNPSPVTNELRSFVPPKSELRSSRSHKGRGERRKSGLTQRDFFGDLVRQVDAADGQHHFGRQLFVALEAAGRDRVAHRLLDLAL